MAGPLEFLKNKAKDVAAAGLNKLPDRGNLFLRYMTGLGNRNLDLDDSTLSGLRDSTVGLPSELREERVHGPTGTTWDEAKPGPWAHVPQSGAINPYGRGYGTDVTHTLGRFMSKVNPAKTLINLKDTYDMVNEVEDPDLVSGKFQPIKALGSLHGAVKNINFNSGLKGFYPEEVARAGMYLSPWKPKPYEVNIDVPYSGDINNREVYNR